MNTDAVQALGFSEVSTQMRPRSTALNIIVPGRSSGWSDADVYFAHSDDSEWLIKIGSSMQPRLRVAHLRAPSGARVVLMAVIPGVGSLFEQWLHWYFEGLRVEGEWFTPWPPVLDLIHRVRALYPDVGMVA